MQTDEKNIQGKGEEGGTTSFVTSLKYLAV